MGVGLGTSRYLSRSLSLSPAPERTVDLLEKRSFGDFDEAASILLQSKSVKEKRKTFLYKLCFDKPVMFTFKIMR